MHFTRPGIDKADKPFRTQLINSVLGYKSVHLVGTQSSFDDEAHLNLAVISSLCHLGSSPPLLSMIIRPASVPRHTLENIVATGFYTINSVSRSIYAKAHQCAARYPREISEFDAVGLTPTYSALAPAPYVKESPIKIGMQLREVIHLSCNRTEMVVGEITELFIKDGAVGIDGSIDFEQLDSVCVTGLDCYHQPAKLLRLPYAKP